ncbi:unnamed protein product [Rotaria sordida]|uniref:F-box domain-containing protein n=2 Tax=Rotaria sordida TaxID=392033 RepID=A0A819WVH8_9BILA|nr:unnamed protein product [Rotaria sordida]CAF4131109.1 unnamed protein product [Rotaria sordida]
MPMNIEYSCVQLIDLPDEILMIILKKLSNVLVLYSLIDVNKRLNTIVCDSTFTSHLTLMRYFSDDCIYPLPDLMLGRFLQILPEIHHNIKWLNLESSSMERILLATNYPNLYGLGLYKIDIETAVSLFIDNSSWIPILKNQISSLFIDTIKYKDCYQKNIHIRILSHIFITFTNLKHLNFCPCICGTQQSFIDILPLSVMSSTLLELYITIERFDYCLYLLDGRVNQLRLLHVNIDYISSSNFAVNNKEKLLNLRFFLLHCRCSTSVYDELILPLLHRMPNLEELDLYLIVNCKTEFIDGNNLKNNIFNHMPRLNQLTFNIRSIISHRNKINLPSNEDIQHTFRDFTDNKIISCVDYFPENKYSHCHIYSYPYKLKYYNEITNNFPGGLFKYVHEISLFDERPFEHEFFCRIAESFPLLEELTVINKKPQNCKRYIKTENDNQDLSIIKYPHLNKLFLNEAHDDYVEEFLIDTKVCLPNNVCLFVKYESLESVTYNFTRNATRLNCAKVNYMCTKLDYLTNRDFQFPKHFKDYFLHVDLS